MEGQGDLVSRLITPITHIVNLITAFLIYLLSSPDPPSSVRNGNAEAGASVLEAQQVPCLTLTLCDSTGLLVFYWCAPGAFSALGLPSAHRSEGR